MPTLDLVLDELKEAFADDKYSILIGDNIGGRIPTLILRGVINHINVMHKRPSIPTRFIDGRHGPNESERNMIVNELQALKSRFPNKRALIVTEFLLSGNNARNIGKVIYDTGVSYDIVTIGRRARVEALYWAEKVIIGLKAYSEQMNISFLQMAL